jgi:hypothetical protein
MNIVYLQEKQESKQHEGHSSAFDQYSNGSPDRPVEEPPRPIGPEKPRKEPPPANPDKPIDPRPYDPDPSPGDPPVDPADEPFL